MERESSIHSIAQRMVLDRHAKPRPPGGKRVGVTWAHERRVTLRLIEPGKPNQNAYIESFNGRFRDECLNEHWFTSLAHAQVAPVSRAARSDARPRLAATHVRVFCRSGDGPRSRDTTEWLSIAVGQSTTGRLV